MRGVSDSETRKPAAICCPHCRAQGRTILSVADDYPTLKQAKVPPQFSLDDEAMRAGRADEAAAG
jgi:hypothetical protein